MTSLQEALNTYSSLILDGATGTELSRMGYELPQPLWGSHVLMTQPQALTQIHESYLEAGAHLICSHSFRTQRYILDQAQHGERCASLTMLSAKLCLKAKATHKRHTWVLGSMAPLADCYRPQDTPSWNICFREHREHAQYLAEAGVDGLILETFSHPREIRAALMAAYETNLPVILSLICQSPQHTLHGESLRLLVRRIETEKWAPQAWGVNCQTPKELSRSVQQLKQSTHKPLVAYAQVGFEDSCGQWHERGLVSPQQYRCEAKKWHGIGVSIIGGCCGTTPVFTKEIAKGLQ